MPLYDLKSTMPMPCTKAGLLTNLGVILILTLAFVESWHRPRPSRQFRKQSFVIFKLYRSQGKASLFITSLSTSSSFRLWYFLPCPMVEPSWHVHHRICYHWTHTHYVYITMSWVRSQNQQNWGNADSWCEEYIRWYWKRYMDVLVWQILRILRINSRRVLSSAPREVPRR